LGFLAPHTWLVRGNCPDTSVWHNTQSQMFFTLFLVCSFCLFVGFVFFWLIFVCVFVSSVVGGWRGCVFITIQFLGCKLGGHPNNPHFFFSPPQVKTHVFDIPRFLCGPPPPKALHGRCPSNWLWVCVSGSVFWEFCCVDFLCPLCFFSRFSPPKPTNKPPFSGVFQWHRGKPGAPARCMFLGVTPPRGPFFGCVLFFAVGCNPSKYFGFCTQQLGPPPPPNFLLFCDKNTATPDTQHHPKKIPGDLVTIFKDRGSPPQPTPTSQMGVGRAGYHTQTPNATKK